MKTLTWVQTAVGFTIALSLLACDQKTVGKTSAETLPTIAEVNEGASHPGLEYERYIRAKFYAQLENGSRVPVSFVVNRDKSDISQAIASFIQAGHGGCDAWESPKTIYRHNVTLASGDVVDVCSQDFAATTVHVVSNEYRLVRWALPANYQPVLEGLKYVNLSTTGVDGRGYFAANVLDVEERKESFDREFYAVVERIPGVPPMPVYGCTDRNAANYNPLATHNDGSCRAPVTFAMAGGQLNCSGSSTLINSGIQTMQFGGANAGASCAYGTNGVNIAAKGYAGWSLAIPRLAHTNFFQTRPSDFWVQIQHSEGVVAKLKEVTILVQSSSQSRVLRYTVDGRVAGLPEARFLSTYGGGETLKLLLVPGDTFTAQELNSLSYDAVDINGQHAQVTTAYFDQVYLMP